VNVGSPAASATCRSGFWMHLNLDVASPKTFAKAFAKPVSGFAKTCPARNIPMLRRKWGLY